MSEELEFTKRLYGQFSSLIETIKVMNTGIGRHIEAVGRFETEIVKLNRHAHQHRQDLGDVRSGVEQVRGEMGQVRGDISQMHTKISHQLDGILLRLDELENAVNSNGLDIKTLQTEAVSQYNDVLNAIQGSTHNNILLRELTERIEAIERRLGPQS
ncbi:hypothetical protein SAMN05880593_11260 [Rhizobium sp. RU36D]|nr:hypothetical protein SAMN05880593_11260 [Rhizobium sp. RU36D]